MMTSGEDCFRCLSQLPARQMIRLDAVVRVWPSPHGFLSMFAGLNSSGMRLHIRYPASNECEDRQHRKQSRV